MIRVWSALVLVAFLWPCLALAQTPRDDVMAGALRLGYDGQAEAGLALIRPIVAENPQDVDVLMLEARLLAWAGHYDQARQAIATLLTAHPDNADIQVLAGDIAWYGGDITGARQRYQAALSLAPDYGDARLGLERVAAADTKRWRIDSGLDVSWFGPRKLKQWQDASLRVGYAWSDDTELHVAGEQDHRFSMIDRSVEVGADHRFLPWLRGAAAVAVTPAASFLPRQRFNLGSSVRLRDDKGGWDATWLSLDWQSARYRSGTVSYIAPGLQQYLWDGQVWLTGRALRVIDENNRMHWGGEGRADWQVMDRFRLFAGYSSAPETDDNITAYTSSRFAGLVAGLTSDVDLTLAGTFCTPLRRTFGVALSVRF